MIRTASKWSALPASVVLSIAAFILSTPRGLVAQNQPVVWSEREKPIAEALSHLREQPDDVRARTTKGLAIEIRELPAGTNQTNLAYKLATLSTEGDFGHDTLQAVATTLADSLREHPLPPDKGQPQMPYIELAQLARYEHVQASLDDPQFAAAMSKMEADDARRQQADFTLTDLQGNAWNLKNLAGKVVLVNFWATWCPPCRKEMPALDKLYQQFKDQGFVILAISDEGASTVKPFIEQQIPVSYPVLLDPGRKVNDLFQVVGIPKSFVYDRTGKMVAQSIDMRTQRQFLEMLAQAGL